MTRTDAKRWAVPVDVARSAPKETAADPAVFFWKEYRVRPLTPAEFAAIRAADAIPRSASYHPFVIESRRVDGTADRSPTNPWEWKLWAFGDTPGEVIDEMLGDTSFLHAESLVPEHAALTAHAKLMREVLDAEWEAEKGLTAAATEWAEFKRAETRKFESATAGKEGAAAAKVRERTSKRLKPRIEELKGAVKAATETLAAARAAIEAARKGKPKCGAKAR